MESKIVNKEYGWFSWHPKWLQWLNNAAMFTVFMTLANTFHQGSTNGLLGSIQTSIETRFELTSTFSSTLMVAFEVSDMLMSILIAYKGTKGCHKPRWTAGLLFIAFLGNILHSLPHFTTPEYIPGEDLSYSESLCGKNSTKQCETEGGDTSSLQYYFAVFLISRICLAVGSSAILQMAVAYLDDSLTRDKFSMYSSVFALGGIFGPAIGFILGGYLLEFYTDFPTIDVDQDINFGPNDPRWVGAWWLGFLIMAGGRLLSLLPMTGYPYDLPASEEMRLKKINEAFGTAKDDQSMNQLQYDFKLKDVKCVAKYLFTNWSWLFMTLYLSCDVMIVAGVSLFGPKFIQEQFSMTPGFAAILLGVLVVPAGAIGAILAGQIMGRLKLTFRDIAKAEFFISIVVCLTGFMFLMKCEEVPFAGVNIGYENSQDISLMDHCNENCSCSNIFTPVCSNENIQYFSPCHAGCLDTTEPSLTEKHYHNCSCIYTNTSTNVSSSPHEATSGICKGSDCIAPLAVFAVFLFMSMIGIFMCETMNLTAVLRVVPTNYRLFALACTSIITKLVGGIPGPIIYGHVFDSACLLWQEDCNKENGSCYYYNNKAIGIFMVATSTCVKVASVIFMLLAWKLYKAPVNEVIDESTKTVNPQLDHTAVEADCTDCANGVVNQTCEEEQVFGGQKNPPPSSKHNNSSDDNGVLITQFCEDVEQVQQNQTTSGRGNGTSAEITRL